MRRQARAEPARHVLHERGVRENEPIANPLVGRLLVAAPELTDLVDAHSPERICALSNGAEGQVGHPEPEHRSGCGDDPLALQAGVRGHAAEQDAEQPEQDAERATAGSGQRGQSLERARRYNPVPNRAGHRAVAQLAEHRSPKPGVAGSSPACPVDEDPASGAFLASTRPVPFRGLSCKPCRKIGEAQGARPLGRAEDGRSRAARSGRSRPCCECPGLSLDHVARVDGAPRTERCGVP